MYYAPTFLCNSWIFTALERHYSEPHYPWPLHGTSRAEKKEDAKRWHHYASCSKSKDDHNPPANFCLGTLTPGLCVHGTFKSTHAHVHPSIACSQQGEARFKHSWVLGRSGWKTTWPESTSHCSQVPSPDLIENNGKTPGEQFCSELANCLSFFSLHKLLFLLLYLTRLSKLWVFSHPDLTWWCQTGG